MMGGLPEYCMYTSISSHVRGCSHDFFFAGSQRFGEKVKGRTTHGGRPGSASSTSRTTRETSSSRSSLSAPACASPTSLPPFFPHRTQTHCRESRRCFPRPVHVLSKFYFPRFTNLRRWGISGPTRSFFPGLLRLFALRAHEKGRGVGWGSRSDFVKMN